MSISTCDFIAITIKSLYRNPLRSGLTLLGVFMGVAAVSATLNIGSITEAQIEAKLAERDKPYVMPYLRAEGSFSPEPLKEEDKKLLQQNIEKIRSISSVSWLFINRVQFEDQEITEIQLQGVSPNYIETTGRKMLQGRFFRTADFAQYRPVAIVDRQLADLLFQGDNPLGQAIYAEGTRLIIIGVTETKTDGSGFQTSGTVWVPQTFANVLSGGLNFVSLQISPYILEDMPELKQRVEKVLGQRHPKTIVYLQDNAEDLLKEKELQEMASRALTLVGLIALSIAGVGIANISIASVVERIKEIGMLRAIGATRTEVMAQFILESVILSLVGGIAAIAIVHGLTVTATTKIIQAPYQFSTTRASLSLGSALLVGVGASFFPALKASRVDVVEALRA
ncbi:ABC transporter permease [Pleurocapsales cyanobacterium LEGE 06147]|nr:ABC transporter permease [Pleurocapsales cyanobacterium LEGE 06147]